MKFKFVHKHNHSYSFKYWLWLFLCSDNRVEQLLTDTLWDAKPKIFTCLAILQKKFSKSSSVSFCPDLSCFQIPVAFISSMVQHIAFVSSQLWYHKGAFKNCGESAFEPFFFFFNLYLLFSLYVFLRFLFNLLLFPSGRKLLRLTCILSNENNDFPLLQHFNLKCQIMTFPSLLCSPVRRSQILEGR